MKGDRIFWQRLFIRSMFRERRYTLESHECGLGVSRALLFTVPNKKFIGGANRCVTQ